MTCYNNCRDKYKGRSIRFCRKGLKMNYKKTLPKIQTEETADCLCTRTPFHLENCWELITDNTNTSCSHAEIETLIQKRIINLIDMELLKALACYHYINHHNLRMALKLRLHPAYQKSSYLDNIRKLKKAGILLSYRPINSENKAESISVSPTRLYCLSQSAYTYMESITSNAHPILPSSARRKMELAAVNQFLIQFETHYGDKITEIEYQKGTKLGNTPFILDSLIRYRTTFPGHQGIHLITILLLSIRKHQNWEKYALSRLHLLGIWRSRHEAECLLPMPVILVEDITMAITLYTKMQNLESLSVLTVYFCPDSLLMVHPPLEALYRCEVGEEGQISAVRVRLIETG